MTVRRKELPLIWLSIIASGTCFLLIPEELPSVLSIFYSNVPPIKKGTDSKIGLGFRLGPNADFQVQFELGPQSNTQPIGPNAGSPNSSKKRQAAASNPKKLNSTNPSEKWINTWQLNLDERNKENEVEPSSIHAFDPTRENNDFVNHLRQLYDNSKHNKTNNAK